MIVRGTTPYHSFILPLKTEDISTFYVTYLQNEEVVLDKQMGQDGVAIESGTEELSEESKITIHLTQEDTLKFHFYPAAEKNIAVIQVRVLDNNGEAYASNPVNERIFGVLKDGVIGDEEI